MSKNTMTSEERKLYYRKYYKKPENKEKQRNSMRLHYWRKKYCMEFNCRIEEIKHLSEQQLRIDLYRESCQK